jgi:hypothetical protein
MTDHIKPSDETTLAGLSTVTTFRMQPTVAPELSLAVSAIHSGGAPS